MVEVVG